MMLMDGNSSAQGGWPLFMTPHQPLIFISVLEAVIDAVALHFSCAVHERIPYLWCVAYHYFPSTVP